MTVTITMLQTRRGEGGATWTAGNSYAASDDFAARMISSNYATGVLPSPIGGTGVARFDQNGNLVDADGIPKLRIDAGSSGADVVAPTVQHMSSIDAMSTTVTVRLTPTGTFRKARISWVNNGASGSAKLNISANCSNDVDGLVSSQSALQRDAQITMGGAIALVSPTPITSLNFSSDGSIVSDTHRLLVTFGA